jgi:hypothetical protein
VRHPEQSVLLFTLAAMLSACSSGPPSTHMLLPSPRTTAAMQRLASQTGAIAVVITTQGDEKTFTVGASQPGLLSGDMLTPDAATQAQAPPQSVAQPFDSLALVYYTESPSLRVAWQDRLPRKSAFPVPPAVGDGERDLSCAALDTELSRAEALRWLARNRGATPYTGAEKLNLQVKHAATDVVVAVGATALVMMAGGQMGMPSGSPAYHYAANLWYLNLEDFRWAISAIDARVEGLLRLKQQNQCAGRPALQAGTTDLTLLERFDTWKAQQSSVQDEHTLLAKRTEAFDELGPKAVVQPDLPAARAYLQAARLRAAQQLLPPDEQVDQILSDALWFGETKSSLDRARKEAEGKVPRGDIVVTDKSFLFANLANYAISPERQQTTVQISYAQLETVRVGNFGLNKWVMVRTKNGQEQYFSIMKPGSQVDRELTQAAGDLLRAKVGSGASGSLENQPEIQR